MPSQHRFNEAAMDTMTHATEVATRLLGPPERSQEWAQLFVALLRELAKGRPVPLETLASTVGWSEKHVVALLEQQPCTEYDGNGSVVGYGITLNETAHAFDVDGRRVYTWCALDALMFPVMIGETARVLSHCSATGQSISLQVSPEGVRDLESANALVSLPRADATPNIRRSFCCHVNFYASTETARPSVQEGTELLSVEEAFRLGRLIAGLMTTATAAAQQA
jgi:alkylmercury lyase